MYFSSKVNRLSSHARLEAFVIQAELSSKGSGCTSGVACIGKSVGQTVRALFALTVSVQSLCS